VCSHSTLVLHGQGPTFRTASTSPFSNHSNSREACISFRSVDSLIEAYDLPLRPGDKRNVVRRADLLPHVAHQAKKRRWVHMELVTHLSVGLSSGESPQHDSLFAGQGWVQQES
jgi:hypothetical protein